MAILFCNIGWMERYQGLNTKDHIVGGGSFVREKGRGNEVCNFSADGNVLYGYVQPPGENIDIDRIGATPQDSSIRGVTVVWTATRPSGGTTVVGWYKNATVFRSYQRFSTVPAAQRRDGIDGYWIRAKSGQAVLLPVDARTCEIPRQVKGAMGQANVWYADSPESAPTVGKVLDIVRGRRPPAPVNRGPRRKQDQERKAQIERAAIRMCCDHFERIGYSVRSVEKDNLGWDLEARSGKTTLRIEVKGLSGGAFAIELTPKEFRAFSEQSGTYRLAVVLKALNDRELFICRFSGERQTWVIDGIDNKSLQIDVKQSASIRCA